MICPAITGDQLALPSLNGDDLEQVNLGVGGNNVDSHRPSSTSVGGNEA